jgi:alkaline phosphatase D
VGTWDDHDFGVNDGGKEYPSKEGSQAALLDFLGEPEDSPRRQQEGVYASYTLGHPPRQVKVILLDTRYHRDPPGPSGDILGEAQWEWFQEELESSRAQVNIIGSGFQFLPVDHRFEKWANFPEARNRLLDIIAEAGVPGVILISGDRHLAEISMVSEAPLTYPLYEITSSGMTHFVTRPNGETNRHRVGPLFTGLNFGILEIDWNEDSPRVRMQIRGEEGEVGVEEVVPLERLTDPGLRGR